MSRRKRSRPDSNGMTPEPQLPTTSVVTPCMTLNAIWGSRSTAKSSWLCTSMKPGVTASPRRVELGAALLGDGADGGDALAAHGHVGARPGRARPVVDRPAPDHQIVAHRFVEGGLDGPLRASPKSGLRRRSRRSNGGYFDTLVRRPKGPPNPPKLQLLSGGSGVGFVLLDPASSRPRAVGMIREVALASQAPSQYNPPMSQPAILPFVHAQGSWGTIGHTVGSMFAPLIADHVEAWTRHVMRGDRGHAPRGHRGCRRVPRADRGARAVSLGGDRGHGARLRPVARRAARAPGACGGDARPEEPAGAARRPSARRSPSAAAAPNMAACSSARTWTWCPSSRSSV